MNPPGEGFGARVRLSGEALATWSLGKPEGELTFDREPAAVEGEALLSAVVGGDERPVLAAGGGAGFDVRRSLELSLRARALRSPRPAASRLPFHYHLLPGLVRFLVGRALYAWKSIPEPDRGAELLRHAWRVSRGVQPAVPLLVLAHDVDTRRGLARAPALAEEEAKRDLQAVYFVVSCMRGLDLGAVRAVRDAGHEIGVHGYDHSCGLPYLSPREIGSLLARAKGTLARFSPRAFRSPALARTPELFEALKGAFAVDSSVPDAEPGDACGMLFPFGLGDLVEVPLTMPMDSTLLMMGLGPPEIARIWRKKIDRLAAAGVPVVLTTHPEPQFSGSRAMKDAYFGSVEHALEAGASGAALDECIAAAETP